MGAQDKEAGVRRVRGTPYTAVPLTGLPWSAGL